MLWIYLLGFVAGFVAAYVLVIVLLLLVTKNTALRERFIEMVGSTMASMQRTQRTSPRATSKSSTTTPTNISEHRKGS